MKEIIKELTLAGLPTKHKLFAWYFAISFCLIGSVDKAPWWFLIALVLNFANSARLLNNVQLPKK